ncbi:homeobox protein MSX-2 [Platysternon megacephalum]|uniref:Homeobox protein MSX-2 n=1 Tax=Platysternon megacephalum TaxID=55544 RepID=A0A4D9EWM7_9SAUR|nr:homeobox protein MSX-2 [Platysternon megacephalum]
MAISISNAETFSKVLPDSSSFERVFSFKAFESAAGDGNECDSSGCIAGNVILKKINNRTERALSEEMRHECKRPSVHLFLMEGDTLLGFIEELKHVLSLNKTTHASEQPCGRTLWLLCFIEDESSDQAYKGGMDDSYGRGQGHGIDGIPMALAPNPKGYTCADTILKSGKIGSQKGGSKLDYFHLLL